MIKTEIGIDESYEEVENRISIYSSSELNQKYTAQLIDLPEKPNIYSKNLWQLIKELSLNDEFLKKHSPKEIFVQVKILFII